MARKRVPVRPWLRAAVRSDPRAATPLHARTRLFNGMAMSLVFSSSVFAAAVLVGSMVSAGTVLFDPDDGILVECWPTVSDLAPRLTVAATEILLPGCAGGPVFFVATKALRISDIALSATGTAADISNVRFGLTPATLMGFTTIVSTGTQAFGGAVLPGNILGRGDVFTIIYWDEGIAAPVNTTASFTTSAVPVPAALPLLAGALGALGLACRKVKKSNNAPASPHFLPASL